MWVKNTGVAPATALRVKFRNGDTEPYGDGDWYWAHHESGFSITEYEIPDKPQRDPAAIRTFETGATRNPDADRPDYEAAFSPLVFEAYGKYKITKRLQAEGSMRADDNWQKGIPFDSYMKSMWRHLVTVWKLHRSAGSKEDKIEALCALLFNVQGYAHELLKKDHPA